MYEIKYIFLLLSFAYVSQSLPVTQEKKNSNNGNIISDKDNDLEYERYLHQVVQLLSNDSNFINKINTLPQEDIMSGKVSEHLPVVSHGIRSKLGELKRMQLSRLEDALAKKSGLVSSYVDETNKDFTEKDLKKLIENYQRVSKQVEQQEEQQYRDHEMERRYQYEQDLAQMSPDQKKKAMEEHQKQVDQLKNHKFHHPGKKDQLQEVWEDEDHMDPNDFDPKTFFSLHDIDGNHLLDEVEVRALFEKDLQHYYKDDREALNHEVSRAAHEMFSEMDTDGDGFIHRDEFLAFSQSPSFEKDEGWEVDDPEGIFTPEEYQQWKNSHHPALDPQIVYSNDVVGAQNVYNIHHDPSNYIATHPEVAAPVYQVPQQYHQVRNQPLYDPSLLPQQQIYQGQPIQQHYQPVMSYQQHPPVYHQNLNAPQVPPVPQSGSLNYRADHDGVNGPQAQQRHGYAMPQQYPPGQGSGLSQQMGSIPQAQQQHGYAVPQQELQGQGSRLPHHQESSSQQHLQGPGSGLPQQRLQTQGSGLPQQRLQTQDSGLPQQRLQTQASGLPQQQGSGIPQQQGSGLPHQQGQPLPQQQQGSPPVQTPPLKAEKDRPSNQPTRETSSPPGAKSAGKV